MKKFGICAAYNNGATLVDIAVNKRYKIEFIATYSKDNPEEVERIRELAESNNINYLHKVDVNSEEFIGFLRDTGVELVFLCWYRRKISL